MNKTIYIMGLGNPLPRYNFTPHNLGFLFIDQMLNHENFSVLKIKEQQAWQAENYVLSKPTTYMNLSGKAVRELFKFSKLTLNEFIRSLIIVHDDISLPMHTVRLKDGKENPGLAGHNGLRSIAAEFQHMGLKSGEATAFYRLRLGCKIENMNLDLASYVLSMMNIDNKNKWVKVINEYLNFSKFVSIKE